MTYFSKDKRINQIANSLVKEGWTLKSRNRHSRLLSPDGKKIITVPVTPSDHRASLNFICQLRREKIIK